MYRGEAFLNLRFVVVKPIDNLSLDVDQVEVATRR